MKGFFMKNSVLKVVSVIFAVVLWGYVMFIVDPVITETIEDVPVSYKDKPSNDLAIVGEREQYVDVEIKATRKEISKIKKEKIFASVDCKNVTKEGVNSVKVEITPYDQKAEPVYLELKAEKVEDKTIEVTESIKGQLEEGYAFDGGFSYSKTIDIRGAEDYYIGRIKRAVLEIDVNGRNENIEEEVQVKFVDNDDVVIDSSDPIYRDVEVKITSSETYSQTADAFKLKVRGRVKKKKDIPVEADLGYLQSVYEVVDIGNEDISVKDGVTILYEDEEIPIDKIMTKPLKIENDGDEELTIQDVGLIIPAGVKLQDENMRTVTVKLKKKVAQEVNPVEQNISQ